MSQKNGAKKLKELPGFWEAFADAAHDHGHKFFYDFSQVGDVTIPGLKTVCYETLRQLAMLIGMAQEDESRRLRLVPPARPMAANDCEAP